MTNEPFDYSLDQFDKKTITSFLREKIYLDHDVDSLLGKTANFTAATAAIMLEVFGKILAANSVDDIKASIEPYAPLILRLQEGIKKGEFKSVSSAQGMSHSDAIIEGLIAYTAVAQVFEQQKQHN